MTPFIFVEFARSQNIERASTELDVLLMGAKTSAGTQPENNPIEVVSAEQAQVLFGGGSQLHLMCVKYFQNNLFKSVNAMAVASGATQSAQWQISASVAANTQVGEGVIHLYIGNRYVPINVQRGTTAHLIGRAILDALSAADNLPIESVSIGLSPSADVRFNYKANGPEGSTLRVHYNYEDNQFLPANLSLTITLNRAPAGADISDANLTSCTGSARGQSLSHHRYTL